MPPVTADHTPERLSAEEREVEALAETLRGWPDEIALARHILRSEWLAGYVAARLADVEARLAAVAALADEWRSLLARSKQVKPYVAGDTVGRYCGKAGREVVVTVNPGNWNTPERLTAFCSTRGCSRLMKVSDLPKRYVVNQWELDAAAKRLLNSLATLHPDPSAVARDE
jgi:hypothetical protein